MQSVVEKVRSESKAGRVGRSGRLSQRRRKSRRLPPLWQEGDAILTVYLTDARWRGDTSASRTVSPVGVQATNKPVPSRDYIFGIPCELGQGPMHEAVYEELSAIWGRRWRRLAKVQEQVRLIAPLSQEKAAQGVLAEWQPDKLDRSDPVNTEFERCPPGVIYLNEELEDEDAVSLLQTFWSPSHRNWRKFSEQPYRIVRGDDLMR